MKTFKVALTRTYLVTLEADTCEQAKIFAEYYLGDCPDLSNKKNQKDKHVQFKKLEMVYNEANKVE